MLRTECVAMILAGGQGSRLEPLTRRIAKPAIPFGGRYRIIDFTLSNCTNSGIYTVGVLTQYRPLALNAHIGIGSPWDLDRNMGGVSVLPPFGHREGMRWYRGTASAIFENTHFIEEYDPEYVLILSGDHVYKMDYSLMLGYHREMEAEATIAVIEVPWAEASRFGIMVADEEGRVVRFDEKPDEPTSNLASMGIYVFTWEVLREVLEEDQKDPGSSDDFGRDVIPRMLEEGRELRTYRFSGYWKDVGTIASLWEAHMDLLEDEPELDIYDPDWRIYSVDPILPPQLLTATARVEGSLVGAGCLIGGEVDHSVIFPGVHVAEGAHVRDSVVMPDVAVGAGSVVERSVVAWETRIGEKCRIGDGERITVVPHSTIVSDGETFGRSSGL